MPPEPLRDPMQIAKRLWQHLSISSLMANVATRALRETEEALFNSHSKQSRMNPNKPPS